MHWTALLNTQFELGQLSEQPIKVLVTHKSLKVSSSEFPAKVFCTTFSNYQGMLIFPWQIFSFSFNKINLDVKLIWVYMTVSHFP